MQHEAKGLSVQDVVEYVVDRIASGVFPIGSRLPPARKLADELGVHRNTVSKAYRALAEMQLTSARPGRGTFVASLVDQNGRVPLSDQIGDTIAEAAVRAQRLGLGEAELRRIADERITAIFQAPPPRAAFVECNVDDLEVAGRELQLLTGFNLTELLISAISENPLQHLANVDLVLTSLFHITEVRRLVATYLPELPVIGVYTHPDEQALAEVAQIEPGSRVGIVVSNPEGGRRYVFQINAYVPVRTEVLVLPSDAQIRELAERSDLLVCSRSRSRQVRSLQLNRQVIELAFHVSRQSVDRITHALVGTAGRATIGSAGR